MAGVKISGLPPAASSLLTDQIAAVQAGTTDKETLQQILTLYQASATNFTGLTGKLEAPTAIADSSGNNNIAFTYTASAINYLTSINSATGNSPSLAATGGNTDINIILTAKGTGTILCQSPTSANALELVPNSGTNVFRGVFAIPTITASRTYTFKDASGTVAFLSDITANTDFVEVTGTSQTIAENTCYLANNAATVVFTIPATFTKGKWFRICGSGSGGWQIAQSTASHQIHLLAVSSTLGVGGVVNSTNRYDGSWFVCNVANNEFVMQGTTGNPDLL